MNRNYRLVDVDGNTSLPGMTYHPARYVPDYRKKVVVQEVCLNNRNMSRIVHGYQLSAPRKNYGGRMMVKVEPIPFRDQRRIKQLVKHALSCSSATIEFS